MTYYEYINFVIKYTVCKCYICNMLYIIYILYIYKEICKLNISYMKYYTMYH